MKTKDEVLTALENDIKRLQEKKLYVVPQNAINDILALIEFYKNK